METTQPTTPTPGLSPDPSQSQPPTASSGASADEQDDEMFNSPWIRAAVRQRMAVQPPGGRLESGQQGEISQFVNAIGERAAQAVVGTAGKALSIPRRAMEASEGLRTTGEYDPAPVVQAASMAVAPGAVLARRAAGAGVGQMAGDAMSGLGLAFGAQDAANEHDLSSLVPAVAGAAMPAIAGPMRAAGQTAARVMARNPIKTAAGIGGAAALTPGAAEAGPAREEAGALARREQPSPMGGAVDAGMELTGAPGSIRDKAPEPSQEPEPASPRKQVAGDIPTPDTADKPAWARPLEKEATEIPSALAKYAGPLPPPTPKAETMSVDMSGYKDEPFRFAETPPDVTPYKKTVTKYDAKGRPYTTEAISADYEKVAMGPYREREKAARTQYEKGAEERKSAYKSAQQSKAYSEAEKKRQEQVDEVVKKAREKKETEEQSFARAHPWLDKVFRYGAELGLGGLAYGKRLEKLMMRNKEVKDIVKHLEDVMAAKGKGTSSAEALTGRIGGLEKMEERAAALPPPDKMFSVRPKELLKKGGIGAASAAPMAMIPTAYDLGYGTEDATPQKIAARWGQALTAGAAAPMLAVEAPLLWSKRTVPSSRITEAKDSATKKLSALEEKAVKKAKLASPAAAPKPAPAAKSEAAPEAAPDAKVDQFDKLMQRQKKQRAAVAKATAGGQPAPKRSKAVGEDD